MMLVPDEIVRIFDKTPARELQLEQETKQEEDAMQFANFRPIGARIFAKYIKKEQVSSGGIILPGVENEPCNTASVLAIGSKVESIKVGDTIYFSTYGGRKMGDDHVILQEEDVLGLL